MKPIMIPHNYDYMGVYLTDKCPLSCSYCITTHHGASFLKHNPHHLTAEQWVDGLNRLELPDNVPVTLQGGEPFVYKGIWQILENVRHKVDIMTALPSFLTKDHFQRLKTLAWNQRPAPYPTIRVSYHKGQNDYKELVERIAELQEILSIGLYYLEHPSNTQEEITEIKDYAQKFQVELRSKEFLGEYDGKMYGTLRYLDAVEGKPKGIKVLCKNTVAPIAPDGAIYRCHSDLYFKRTQLALGNILDETFEFPRDYLPCQYYGLCSECDVKIKTNHYQQHGYTSVDIVFEEGKTSEEETHEPQTAEGSHY